jgi:ATP-binding cassette subfamily C (CFTR/MRP) protein 1
MWSYLSWRWVNPLLRAGNARQLQSKDLWELPPTDTSQYLTNRLHALWDKELATNPLNPSLIKCYRQAFGWGMALHQFLGLWESVARIAAVVFIGQLIEYFADFRTAYNDGTEAPPIGRGLGWCAAFCVTNGFLVPFHHGMVYIPSSDSI